MQGGLFGVVVNQKKKTLRDNKPFRPGDNSLSCVRRVNTETENTLNEKKKTIGSERVGKRKLTLTGRKRVDY